MSDSAQPRSDSGDPVSTGATEEGGRRSNGRLRGLVRNGPAVLFLVALVVLWELVVRLLHVNDFILPAPSAVWVEMVKSVGVLLSNAKTTLYEIVVGFGLGNAAAVLIAVLISRSALAERTLMPLFVASQVIPKIAIAPVFLIWFGTGVLPKVLITALMCFFPTVVNTAQGLGATDPNAIRLLRLVGAGRGMVFARIQFPNALPAFFSGLKVSIALAVIGAVIGEWVGANSGLGYLILYATQVVRTDLLFAALVSVSILGIALYLLVLGAERLFSWRQSDTPIGGL